MTSTTDLAAGPSVIEVQDAAYSPTLASPPAATAQVDWSLPTRTAFRFAVTYCVLYVFSSQMFGALFGSVLRLLPFRLMPPMFWASMQTFQSHIAINWLRFPEPLALNNGAGDKPIDYALAVGLLVIASGDLVGCGPEAPELSAAARLVPALFAALCRHIAGRIWLGEAVSASDALSAAQPLARAVRTFFAHGGALVANRLLAGVRDLYWCR